MFLNYKTMKIFATVIVTLFLFISCSKGKEYTCESGNPNIVGAVCNDGTTSDATGSGACSSHGGVDHWVCCCE